jgi:PAS domain S-box-containing protein
MVTGSIPLAKVVDTMAEGVLVLDPECRIVLWNQALADLTGWTSAEMIGRTCSDLTAPLPDAVEVALAAEPRSCDCRLLKQLGGRAVVSHVKCRLRTRSGDRIPVLKNGRVLFDGEAPVAAVITFTDLRRVDELERALVMARGTLAPGRPPGRLIGAGREMAEVYERIRLAADSDAAVLILGETGTGKELVADAIHQEGTRRGGPLVKVNCSALPETLLESELFGHVRGAFTGATRDKVGRFEAADTGTIFLDEIGDISPLIQLKLLRFLQGQEFERVGESVTRKVDVRVVCATNRDLREQVRRGEFREDLYYRIRVFPIQVPPLRQRKTDIPLLVQAFIERFSRETGKHITGMSDEVLHCFMDHCWPGNVRELENAVEHAFVTCRTPRIGLADLPAEIRMLELRSAHCRELEGNPHRTAATRPLSRNKTDREQLLATLEECGWNRSQTARVLGIDRTTVWRRMRQWGLEPPD